MTNLFRFKVDEYIVREKGKQHSVLVFPHIKYMWAFDNGMEDGCVIDGVADAFEALKYAMAILVEASDKIIYFPCKQAGIGFNYNAENCNLILCTPKAMLKRSSWIAIRKKLIPVNKKGSYVLQYNSDKLIDFCENNLMHLKSQGIESELILKEEVRKKMRTNYLEDVVGENLFLLFGKEECYYHHYQIVIDLENLNEEEYGRFTSLGWIVTNKGLKLMRSDS